MTVLTFPSRRSSSSIDELLCECGSSWFDLVRVDSEGDEIPGSVLLHRDGRVVGYAGVLRCHECGQRR